MERIYFAELRHTTETSILWAKRSNTPKISAWASVQLVEERNLEVLQWETHHAQDKMNCATSRIFCHILILFWQDGMLRTHRISHIQEERSTGIIPESSPSWRSIYWTQFAIVIFMQFHCSRVGQSCLKPL